MISMLFLMIIAPLFPQQHKPNAAQHSSFCIMPNSPKRELHVRALSAPRQAVICSSESSASWETAPSGMSCAGRLACPLLSWQPAKIKAGIRITIHTLANPWNLNILAHPYLSFIYIFRFRRLPGANQLTAFPAILLFSRYKLFFSPLFPTVNSAAWQLPPKHRRKHWSSKRRFQKTRVQAYWNNK